MYKKSGQVLLITIMLLATALTVALSVSFTSRTETQITKLEEESQKALAAAEAGIEEALKTGSGVTIGEGSLVNLTGFSGTATIDETPSKNYFISPLMQKDEQYTFYLSSYSYPNFNNHYYGDLEVYYGTQTSCSNIQLEMTFIYYENGIDKIKRFIADTNNPGTADNIGTSTPKTIEIGPNETQTFNCSTDTKTITETNYPNIRILTVRTLSNATKLGFKASSTLFVQGKTITSTARSTSGVTKQVKLFQSYPQIPAEFFVTSF